MASILDANRGPEIVAVSVVLAILSIVALTLRVWSRLISKNQGFWWDDWFALASLVRATRYSNYQLRSSGLTKLSKALRACSDIHRALMGLRRVWSSYKSTYPESTCFKSQVLLRSCQHFRPRYLPTEILSNILLYPSPQNEVDALSYRCIYRISARHCLASLRYLVRSISMYPYTKSLASFGTRSL